MIFVMSIALGISFLGFYISFGAAQNWINTHVYTKEYLYEIEQQKLKQLERYIEKEGIKLKNIEKISTWQKENKNISLNIFSEDVLIYDSWNDYKYNAGYTYADLIRIGYDSKKKIEFQDGKAIVFMMCISNPVLENMVNVFLLVIWFVIYILSVTVIMNRNIKEYRKIDILSHDLKTPLSSIMLYVGLLEDYYEKGSDEEKYLNIIEQQAYKMRSNILNILYIKKNIKKYRCWIQIDAFIEIIRNEFIRELEVYGFIVDVIYEKKQLENKKVYIDREGIKILYNNIIANIINYADKTDNIKVYISKKSQFLNIVIENKIRESSGGTGYGTEICREVMENVKGCYKCTKENDIYLIELFYSISERR